MLWADKSLNLSKSSSILGLQVAEEEAIQAEIYEDFIGITHCMDSNYFIVVINYEIAVKASFWKRGGCPLSKTAFVPEQKR